MHTLIHVFCFKNGWNRCMISGRKAALVAWQKNKTRFVTLRRNPWGDPPISCVSVYGGPSHIFQVSSRSVQVRKTYNRPPQPPKWMQYRLFEHIETKNDTQAERNELQRTCYMEMHTLNYLQNARSGVLRGYNLLIQGHTKTDEPVVFFKFLPFHPPPNP